jgi:DNA-binding helix-hairpin-helix protein with protein kinase domain
MARGERRKRLATAVGLGAGLAAGIAVLPMSAWVASGSALGALLLGMTGVLSGPADAHREARAALRSARARWLAIERRWQEEAGSRRFDAKRRELEATRAAILDLTTSGRRLSPPLDAPHRERQRRAFLDRFPVAGARVSGLGPSRKAVLQSYGIETAADVTPEALAAVPGFGASLGARLLEWRHTQERSFVFDAACPLGPADLAALERDIAERRARLEAELRNGAAQLHQIRDQILARRQALRPAVERALKALARAEAEGALF